MAADVTARFEQVEPPSFTGEPGDEECFDWEEVRDDEPVAFTGDECSVHELAESVRHRVIEQLDRVEPAYAHKLARMGEVG